MDINTCPLLEGMWCFMGHMCKHPIACSPIAYTLYSFEFYVVDYKQKQQCEGAIHIYPLKNVFFFLNL